MSLINDALKRARQSQQNNPPYGAPPLPPIEPPARGGSGWMLVLAAILFLAAASLFVGVTIFKHPAPPVETAKAREISTPKLAPAGTAAVPISVQTLVPLPAPAQVSTSAPVSTPASNAVPAMRGTNTMPAVAKEQIPKLQGIIFNAANPLAILSGKTVSAGDHAGDYEVKQISKSSVVLQRPDGSRQTLNIGE